jgi:putative heme-binding domain-containing protein
MPDVIKSSDKAFRPVDTKMGPDGAIYIADWYNPVINHGEVDFRSPLRDHTHGRIWRITAKDRMLAPRPKIAGAAIGELLDRLRSPEQYTRDMARRELYERDAKEVAGALGKWVAAIGGTDAEAEHQKLEALWTYETIDVVEPNLLASLLAANDPHVRAAATHALYFWANRMPADGGASPTLQSQTRALELLAGRVGDENSQVRLNAVIALGQIPSLRSMELAMSAMDRPTDRWIDYALYLTINKLKDTWLPAVSSGQFTFNDNPKHLAVALGALDSSEAVAPLLALLKRGAIPAERAGGMIGVIASAGGPQELAELWDYVLRAKDRKLVAPALGALLAAARDRNVQPAVKTVDVVPLISEKDESVAVGAVRLAGAWRVREAVGDLKGIAMSKTAGESGRAAAIEALANIGGQEAFGLLSGLAADGESPSRVAAIRGLAAIDLKKAAAAAAEVLSSKGAPADPGILIGAFLQRQDGGRTLAGALGGVKLTPDLAKLALRFIYSTGRPEPELENLLRASADINTQLQNLSPEQVKQLAIDVQKNGDAGRGETIFRSKTANCFTCHAIGGSGGNVGPDLSAVGTASPMEYLIESILEPNKNVKEGFEALAVTTKANDFYAGIRVRQTEKELVLRDALSSQITIPLNTIKKQQNAGSLMPSGMADLLTKQEFLDLVKFISVLGTPGHDVTAAGPVVRRWRVLDMPLKEGATPVELDDTYSFSPIYSTVGGELPMSELPKHKANVVTFVVEVSTPGAALMSVNSTAGLKAWINTSDLDLSSPRLELSRGGHLFSIQIDRNVRSDPLKITIQEAADSKARFRIVGGR